MQNRTAIIGMPRIVARAQEIRIELISWTHYFHLRNFDQLLNPLCRCHHDRNVHVSGSGFTNGRIFS